MHDSVDNLGGHWDQILVFCLVILLTLLSAPFLSISLYSWDFPPSATFTPSLETRPKSSLTRQCPTMFLWLWKLTCSVFHSSITSDGVSLCESLIYMHPVCARSLQSCLTLQPYGLEPSGLLCPWHSLDKNTSRWMHLAIDDLCLGLTAPASTVDSAQGSLHF